jgi:hypothetical protein
MMTINPSFLTYLQVPDYHQIIADPMDIETLQVCSLKLKMSQHVVFQAYFSSLLAVPVRLFRSALLFSPSLCVSLVDRADSNYSRNL